MYPLRSHLDLIRVALPELGPLFSSEVNGTNVRVGLKYNHVFMHQLSTDNIYLTRY